MKVAFIAHASLCKLHSKIARVLSQKHGVKSWMITFTSESCRYCLDSGAFEGVHDLEIILKDKWGGIRTDEEYLKLLEEKYGLPNLWPFVFVDRVLRYYPYEYALKVMVGCLEFWEDFLVGEGIDAIIAEIGETSEYTAYSVAKKLGVSYLYPNQARISNRFTLVQNPHDRWEAVERVFADLKNREVSAEELRDAQAFLTQFRERKSQPSYLIKDARTNPLRMQVSLLEPAILLGYKWKFSRTYRRERKNIRRYPPYRIAQMRLGWTLNYYLLKLFNPFEVPPEGEKYILYALHLQPEASTAVRGPFYEDQPALIENIGLSLPAGYKLYVKEHVVSLGRRSLGYYKRIKRLPNVRLVSPSLHSHDLIRKASAVVTISGTVGWEGLLYQKPVISFGSAFYNAFDPVFQVHDIKELPYILKRALAEEAGDGELLLKFIAAVLKGTFVGDINDPGLFPVVLGDENIEKIADAIAFTLQHPEAAPWEMQPGWASGDLVRNKSQSGQR